MRLEFELTDEQLNKLLDASKPTPVMAIGDPYGGPPIPMFGTPQENANRAWRNIAEEMGFVWDSVQPISGKDEHFFTAEVDE